MSHECSQRCRTCRDAYFAGGPSGALAAAASSNPPAAVLLDAAEPTLLEAAPPPPPLRWPVGVDDSAAGLSTGMMGAAT